MVQYSTYNLKPGELTGSGPRRRYDEAIFIAFSFSAERSLSFRIKLEQEIRRTPSLSHLIVLDGKVPVGENWAGEIRDRLKRSRVVIADLSLLSPEVLFECGFAWGLGRPILPVTHSNQGHARLPRWLTDIQFGHFSTEEGWRLLIDSLSLHITRVKHKRLRSRSGAASPGKVLFLKSDGDLDQLREQVVQVSLRFGLNLSDEHLAAESLEDTDVTLAHEAANSSLLIGTLRNVSSDSFVQFATGIVTAEPNAGASSRRLVRRVILVVPSIQQATTLTADSARRVVGTVRVVTPNDLAQELVQYGKTYQRWYQRQAS